VTGPEDGQDHMLAAAARMSAEVVVQFLGHLAQDAPGMLAKLPPPDAPEVTARLATGLRLALEAVDPAQATARRALAEAARIARAAGASDDTAACWEALLRITEVLDSPGVTAGEGS